MLAKEQNWIECVIVYACHSLQSTERNPQNYSSFKLELLVLDSVVTEKNGSPEAALGGLISLF